MPSSAWPPRWWAVTRRQRSAGVLWRPGVVVASASALWRASSVAVVLPDGEQLGGTVRGVGGGHLAVVSFADRGMLAAARR